MIIDNTIAAVVTGGASGLGAATARLLASKGAKVALFDMNVEKGEAVASEIGGIFCKVNVTSDEDVDAGFRNRCTISCFARSVCTSSCWICIL